LKSRFTSLDLPSKNQAHKRGVWVTEERNLKEREGEKLTDGRNASSNNRILKTRPLEASPHHDGIVKPSGKEFRTGAPQIRLPKAGALPVVFL
jgi:hypothetical protein